MGIFIYNFVICLYSWLNKFSDLYNFTYVYFKLLLNLRCRKNENENRHTKSLKKDHNAAIIRIDL